jgi:hypothetical protein
MKKVQTGPIAMPAMVAVLRRIPSWPGVTAPVGAAICAEVWRVLVGEMLVFEIEFLGAAEGSEDGSSERELVIEEWMVELGDGMEQKEVKEARRVESIEGSMLDVSARIQESEKLNASVSNS